MTDQTVIQTLDAITSVLPETRPVALHEPEIGEPEKKRVMDCLDSGWVSTVGEYVTRLEQALCDYTQARYCIPVVNGTSALHMALMAVGVQAQQEVLLPALTFVGTANPVHYTGAIPHFVESEMQTFGVDPEKLDDYLASIGQIKNGQCLNKNTGRVISALIVVHILGTPARITKLVEVARRWHLQIVEDAAESLGAWSQQQHTGTLGDIGILSFNGNKIITAGGGGAILTNNADTARYLQHMTTTAKQPHPWHFIHDAAGFNYRIPNLNAALVFAQLDKLDNLLERKKHLHQCYRQALATVSDVYLFEALAGDSPNYWLNCLLVGDTSQRDELLTLAHQQQLFLRPFWTPLHQLPMYADCPRMPLDTAEEIFSRGVCLPSSARLTSHA